MKVRIFLYVLAALFFNSLYALAQSGPPVTSVNINTGNPAFPFPQFLPYAKGKNLGTDAAPGVTHADLEKAIREAYKIMMNRAFYTGHTLGSLKYIGFNNNSLEGSDNKFVSEGDGYAMLAAAYMADKETFNGLWCYIHDNRLSKVIRYLDCQPLRMDYSKGGNLPGWQNTAATPSGDGSNDSAADGDWDIAMALLMAYKQWGENSGVTDACGNQINYKTEAIKFLKALTDTTQRFTENGIAMGYLSGDIGFDGYPKDGNTWGELTTWAYPYHQTECKSDGGITLDCPSSGYFDYQAPGYYKAFADFLEAEQNSNGNNEYTWNISQFRRAWASSTWLMGKLYEAGHLPFAGGVTVSNDGSTVTFPSPKIGNGWGENFRLPWRTIADYIWHGDPQFNWDPVNHKLINGTNSYLKDNADRLAAYIKKPSTWGVPCQQMGNDPYHLMMDGPMNLSIFVDKDGSLQGLPQTLGVNWHHGASATAAVASGDLEVISYMYQQLEIEWDTKYSLTGPTGAAQTDERYINSIPVYFHGWFRLLGMLTLTGNLHSPMHMVPAANVRVYLDNDKTYGFQGDLVTYKVDYRNYGSVAAQNVKIELAVPADFEVVSIEKGGQNSGGKIIWNIGTVPGYKTGQLNATRDSMKVVLRVIGESGRHCPQVTVSGSNFQASVSDEYPNNASATMEQNCFDIVGRALQIEKLVDRTVVNPGDRIEYTLNFENSTEAGWLNGGRPGVRFMYSHGYMGPANAITKMDMYTRIIHGAAEPYIDYGNYRFSIFVNETGVDQLAASKTSPGWYFYVEPYEGAGARENVQFLVQKIPFGSDANGSWNQRLVVKFASQLAAPSHHLWQQYNNAHRIKKGTIEPFEAVIQIETQGKALDYTDDWSFSTDYNASNQNDVPNSGIVVPDFTDPNNPAGVMLNKIHPFSCSTHGKTVPTVLVEEYDGYGWRRVFGTGPLPGREAANVVVVDSLPDEVVWGGFVKQSTLQVDAVYDPDCHCVKWEKNALLVGEKGQLKYWVRAKTSTEFGTPCPFEKDAVSKSYIWAESESALLAEVLTRITCEQLPPPPPAVTSMYKTSDKTNYAIGEEITYSVYYRQTQGTIANPDLTSNADWTQVKGGAPSYNGTIKFPSGGEFIYHDYSHGTNGTMNLSVKINNAYNNFTLILRYQSGDPSTGSFSGVGLQIHPGPWGVSQGAMLAIYDGEAVVAQTNAFKPYASDLGDAANLFVRLDDDKMSVWLNKDPEVDAPTITASGLPVQPGYIGFYNGKLFDFPGYAGGAGGENPVIGWNSSFDSAFDVELSDILPANLTYTNGSVTTLYNENGRYSALPVYDQTLKELTWRLVSGKTPMMYGDSVAFRFTAKVDACPSNFTTNTAYAEILGRPANSVGAQNVAGCQDILTTCEAPTIAQLTPQGTLEICEGGGIQLTVTTDAKPGDMYFWYKDGEMMSPPAADNPSLLVTEPGEYYVVIADDIDAGNPVCQKESNHVLINVQHQLTPGSIRDDQVICSGEIASPLASTAAASGGSGTYLYQWQISADNVTFTDIQGATGLNYSHPVALTSTTYFRRNVSGGVCPSVSSNVVTVKVNAVPPIPRGVSVPVCEGEDLVLTATDIPGASYIWTGPNQFLAFDREVVITSAVAEMTGVYTVTAVLDSCFSPPAYIDAQVHEAPPSPSANYNEPLCEGEELVLTASTVGAATYNWSGPDGFTESGQDVFRNPATASMRGQYSVVAVENGCSSAPAVVDVIVNPVVQPQISINNPGTQCSGTNIVFNATYNDAGDTPVFQWRVNNVVVGTNNPSYESNNFTDGDRIIVTMLSSAECAPSTPVTSNEVTIDIQNSVRPLVAINDPGPICPDQTVNFEATVTGGGSNPRFQWYLNDAPVGTGLAEYENSSLSEGDEVYVEMISSSSCAAGSTVRSNLVVISLTDDLQPSVTVTAPNEICQGDNATFTAISVNSGNNPTYKWKINGVEQAGSTSETFSTNQLTDQDQVSVEMTSNESCVSVPVVNSDPVTVVVMPVLTPSVSIKTLSSTICSGEEVEFEIDHISGEGDSPAFQWYINNSEAGDGQRTFKTAQLSGQDEVKVIMTTNYKCAAISFSESNTVTVEVRDGVDPSVTIGIANSGSAEVCEGTPVNFVVTGMVGGSSATTYQWMVDGVNAGNDQPSFTLNNPENNDQITLQISNLSGCATAPAAVSAPVTLTVRQPEVAEVVINGPGPICEGDKAVFTISSITGQGSSPGYQWIKNGQFIPDAINSSFESYEVEDGDIIHLRVTVSDQQCVNQNPFESNPAEVQKFEKPEVEILATQTEICPGGILNLGLVSQGFPISYQWIKDGQLTGESGVAVSVNQPGIYKVIATTAEGCRDTSASRTITMAEKPDISIIANSGNIICQGGFTTLESRETNSAYQYIWMDESGNVLTTGTSSYQVSQQGSYKLAAINSSGCIDTSNTITVLLQSPAAPVVTGNQTPVCESSNNIYSIQSPNTASGYNWTVPPGAAILSGQGTPSISVKFGTTGGNVSVVEVTQAGCVSPSGQLGVILQGCGLIPDFTIDPNPVCQNSTVFFTNATSGASASAAYIWDFGSSANPSTASGPGPHSVTYSNPGNHSVKLTVNDGVTRDVTKSVTVSDLVVIPSIDGNTGVCQGSEANYSVSGIQGLTYHWLVTGGTVISGQGTEFIRVRFTEPGQGQVSLQYSGACSPDNTLNLPVSVNSAPPVSISSSSGVICPASSVEISLTGSASGSVIWYRNGEIIPGATGSSYGAAMPGNYKAEVNIGGCRIWTNEIGLIGGGIVVDAGPDLSIEEGQSVQLFTQVSESVTSYTWLPKGIPSEPSPIVQPQTTTDYIVTATGENGCRDSDTVRVTVVSPLYIPNAFTPNGDGRNDEWGITGWQRYDKFSIEIFNRWGSLVYSTEGTYVPWQGQNQSTGEEMPVATYYYVIQMTLNGRTETKAGSVLLSK